VDVKEEGFPLLEGRDDSVDLGVVVVESGDRIRAVLGGIVDIAVDIQSGSVEDNVKLP